MKQKKWKSDFKVMCIISMGYTKKTGMHWNKRKNLLPSAKHLEEWWGAASKEMASLCLGSSGTGVGRSRAAGALRGEAFHRRHGSGRCESKPLHL